MMANEVVYTEAIDALNRLVQLYISEFFPKIGPRKKSNSRIDIQGPSAEVQNSSYTKRDRDVDYLLKCSEVEEPTFEDLRYSIFLTLEAMKKFEYEKTYGITNMKIVRRKVEEIKSIISISAAYPESAVKRLKNITKIHLTPEMY
jgi:hypothetical protein